ncbi:dipeptidase [Robertkochia sediminum]|uniref:dipeptidase n=1 Tax=Robertkochia sediminum TaxID=2785326 RepID=UPI0019339071|nr:dipeptidase [Robertkochia sediminum]MBL7473329.1 dipeptidase [Robertkochia sediminum]
MRKPLLSLIAALSLFSCKEQPQTTTTSEAAIDTLALAKSIHEKVITIDTHCDINVNNFTDSINYTQDLHTQITLPKMEEGGLDVAWFIVYTGQDTLTTEGYQKAYENAMAKFEAIHKLTEEIAPEAIELAYTAAEARSIASKGKKVAMIGIENGYPIGTDINNVKKFYDLGGRYMSLAHQGHSQLSDSNTGEQDSVWLHNGLSELGRKVIAEMNKYGMMVDISHPSKAAIKEMIELSKAPVIASHSSARAICDHSRNLDDEQLQWIKENGGVVQTVAFSNYVDTKKHQAYNEKLNAMLAEKAEEAGFTLLDRSEARQLPAEERSAYYAKYMDFRASMKEEIDAFAIANNPVDVSDFVDHIDYLVEKIGLKHVGISSDFDGGGGVYGWNDASETFNVTLELVKRGYTEEEIRQLWGENLLRVMGEVEQVAASLQKSDS